ncbi:MAG: histidinol dehydrogenase [Cyclobacteriaceae bacterium]|nr:histidinol dehydrogenase [Cyclobacteriaceae bacterium]
MKVLNNPSPDTWSDLIKRPQLELEFLESSVRNTLKRVKLSGDQALYELTQQYDGVKLDDLKVSGKEIDHAINTLDKSIKEAIGIATNNIRAFHNAQKRDVLKVETMPGVSCWRKSVPIQKIGIYIPGGSAPLFSTVLMLGIPASIAGCEEIILCTPPNKDGSVNAAILYAASIAGIKKIFKVGGAQAIAAMAYGTQSIPPVYKIFGPGNQYVTKAKQMISQEGVAIDMPAGPSEVMVIVDETADASFVAADLLSQAEHGADSQVVLVALDESKAKAIQTEIDRQVNLLPRKEIALQSLQNSLTVIFSDSEAAMKFANEYAPEHLILNTKDCDALSEKVINAGSVFLGPYSPEAIGDYASGTNHTLPTNGFAKAYSGVSLESFTKMITYQKLSSEGLKNLGPSVEIMAEAEQLDAHKQAVSIRLKKLK